MTLARADEVTLGDSPLAVTLNGAGQYTTLRLEDRPTTLTPGGGWSIWDLAGGRDETVPLPLDATWPDDNPWALRGSLWTLGHGWVRQPAPADGGPGPARLTLADGGYSDGLRLLFAARGLTAVTLTVDLRQLGFTGQVRLGAVPLSGQGEPTGDWIPFDPLPAPPADGEPYRATCTLAPPPRTALVAVWIGAEEATGSLEVAGAAMTIHAGAKRVALAGELTATATGAHYRATGDGLLLEADYRVVDDQAVGLEATLTATAPGPRVLTVRHTLPIGSDGWRWWDNLDRTVTLADEGDQMAANWRHLAGGHLYSPWPLGCLTRPAPAQGVALMAPLSQPLLSRFAYLARQGLTFATDVGLAPELGQSTINLRLAIANISPVWGLRAALALHYRLYPEDQGAGIARYGARFAAANPDALPDSARFGLLFDEDAGAHLAWSRGQRLLPLTALQPWGVSAAPTALERAEQVAAADPPLSGQLLGRDGAPVRWTTPEGGFFEPWSTSPALLHDGPISRINPVLAARLQGADGQPLDGVALVGTGRIDTGWQLHDFAPEHLRASGAPLVADRVSRRPASYTALAHLDFLRELADRLHARGQWLIADLPPEAALPFVLPLLDGIGGSDAGMSEEHLMWLRAMQPHKPLTFLDPALLDRTLLLDDRSRLWQQAIQWAAFPGTAGYLSPRALEAMAGPFDLFVPLLREIAAAGWQPVPYATLNDADVRVERYGSGDGLFLIVRNLADQQRLVTLTLEPLPLGLVSVSPEGFAERRLVFVNLLSRRQRGMEFAVALNRWQATFPIRARQMMVLTPYRIDQSLLSAAGLASAGELVDGVDDRRASLTAAPATQP